MLNNKFQTLLIKSKTDNVEISKVFYNNYSFIDRFSSDVEISKVFHNDYPFINIFSGVEASKNFNFFFIDVFSDVNITKNFSNNHYRKNIFRNDVTKNFYQHRYFNIDISNNNSAEKNFY